MYIYIFKIERNYKAREGKRKKKNVDGKSEQSKGDSWRVRKPKYLMKNLSDH